MTALLRSIANAGWLGRQAGVLFDLWRQGWVEALQWPALSWLQPRVPVRRVMPDGSEKVCFGLSDEVCHRQTPADVVAVYVPEDCLLRRTLSLPRLGSEDVARAIALEVQMATPFPEATTVSACRVVKETDGGVKVEVAITSTALVDAHIERLRSQLGAAAVPEVWAEGCPVLVFAGFGEAVRLGRERWHRRIVVSLLLLALLALIAVAAVPVWHSHRAAVEAERAVSELVRSTRPQVMKREQLARFEEQLKAIHDLVAADPDVLHVLERVTQSLPDDAMLTRLEIEGSQVRLVGQADNASRLLESLSADRGFRAVRAPQGIGRAPSSNKEVFTIELEAVAAEEKR